MFPKHNEQKKTWQKLRENPGLFQRYFTKEYIIKAIRAFFEAKEYHELESPILTPVLPQERYLDPLMIQSEFNNESKSSEMYLIPSTERFNKIILAAGLGNHFVVTKVFRGLEEISPNHSPEFTMLEWYTLGSDYIGLMKETENLLLYVKKYVDKKLKQNFIPQFTYQGRSISLSTPWYRFSVDNLLRKYCKISLSQIFTLKKITGYAKSQNIKIQTDDDWQSIFELIWNEKVELNLPKDKPVFVYDYPKQICPLTKTKDSDPNVCEKVELYIAGKEIANGYTELRDFREQNSRFLIEQQARKILGKKSISFDHEIIRALESGIPPVAGMGLGIDRLAMIFANASSISEINYFPASEMFE